MAPTHPSDPTMYGTFVGHRSPWTETWIAVGGWQFSCEVRTKWTWSDMAASADNRRKFIDSAIWFMDKYGFQGIERAWAYPGIKERGGRQGDKDNFVTLLKEFREHMKSSNRNYGISVLIPGEPGYSMQYDLKGMEPYVNWFNLGTWDLHGHWDAFNGWGTSMHAHTDARDIEKVLEVYFQAGLKFSKFNLGVAWYGRGYTIRDQTCGDLGTCEFSGPSASIPDSCTNEPGVLSNHEIRTLLRAKHGLNATHQTMQRFRFSRTTPINGWGTMARSRWLRRRCLRITVVWVAPSYGAWSMTWAPVYMLERISRLPSWRKRWRRRTRSLRWWPRRLIQWSRWSRRWSRWPGRWPKWSGWSRWSR
ncbi:glycoside hydrolase [Eremomyces bilateralis CBS 781.70]|uniref:chitinase n=1 Tax=Eremomyces bilateralis CBS 781.70 TaxID=1392243 RepID=A0A6G1FXM7_9PEZI|nr:glycoside hydrolase [Eremomyces bilateralis CBS 781.70]KAF1810543.1 glycoside hydrolase [Eremomyces bilateralis CBS 781.70]